MSNLIPPVTPGEILLEEFLIPLGISQNALARAIDVPPRRINEIVLGKRSVTADTALRLSTYFALSDTFWTNLQTRFDLEIERGEMQGVLDRIVPLQHASGDSPHRRRTG